MENKINDFLNWIKTTSFADEHDKLKQIIVPKNVELMKMFIQMGAMQPEDFDTYLEDFNKNMLMNNDDPKSKYTQDEMDQLKIKIKDLFN